ncbi:hypothetical protein [Actinoplanes subglobosus]|uniref:Uncharacterized protein n=1 Tax=Actinoplanes subglobosus TaxID=1547892 RepID=A0ABV8J7I6_9ACTN
MIRGIRAVVVGTRNPPLTGTEVAIGCGEPTTYQFPRSNLDVEPPTVTSEIFGAAEDLRLEPIKFPYGVSAKNESFQVEAVASKFDVYWEIEIEWSWNGQEGRDHLCLRQRMTVSRQRGGERFEGSTGARDRAGSLAGTGEAGWNR